MRLIYEIKEVRNNIICRWYNLDEQTGLKIFKQVITEATKLLKNGEDVKIYLTAKGIKKEET